MIESLHIENFMSWKESTTFTFSPGVNVIVGPTDSGKSAIIRALEWVLYNRPSGNDFISWDTKGETRIKVDFNDYHIERTKGGNLNTYTLNDTVLKGFGQTTPDEILKAHNINRDMNFQAQFDPIYLLQQSPGYVAKHFNEIAELEEIHSVSKALKQHYQITKRDLQRRKEEKAEITLELEGYKNLPVIRKAIKEAEGVEYELANMNRAYTFLTKQRKQIVELEERVAECKQDNGELLKAVNIALRMKHKIEVWKGNQRYYETRKNVLLAKTTLNKQRAEEVEEMKKRLEIELDVCPLCGRTG